MQKNRVSAFIDSRVGISIIALIVSVILILGNESMVSTKSIGGVILVCVTLFLLQELWTRWRVKKSLKSAEITNIPHSTIASYFERNDIKYIYKPKEEKLFDFYLPQYDVYVKYWDIDHSKRDELIKYAKKGEMKYIEIFYDKLNPVSLLHSSFMKKLSEVLKKK